MRALSKREKRLLQGLGAFLGVLFIYFAIIMPIINFKSGIEEEFESNLDRLEQLDKIYSQYKEIAEKKKRYENQLRSTRGTTTLVEENAKSVGILNKKVYTRDRPSNLQGKYKKVSTDVKFEGVDITSILNFLYKMENSGRLIKISYIRINQALKGRDTYDVTIKFDTLTSQ